MSEREHEMSTISTDTMPVKVERVDDIMRGGFRQNWISGGNDGAPGVDTVISFDLDAGAGLGNPFLTLTVEIEYPTGEVTKVYEQIDMREFVNSWTDRIVSEEEAKAVTQP